MPRPLGKQAQAIEAYHTVTPVLPPKRPPPPSELDEPAAKVWKQIVGAMPPPYFTPETRPVLIELCNVIVIAQKINLEVAALQSFTDPKAIKLIDLKLRVSGSIAMLSAKLRICPSAQYDSTRANTKADKSNRAPRPWELHKGNGGEDQLPS